MAVEQVTAGQTWTAVRRTRGANAREFWRRFRKNRAAVAGLFVLIVFALMAIFAPVLAPYAPDRISNDSFVSPGDSRAWLGTDDLGRDMLSGIIYGARVSLVVGMAAAFTSAIIGVIIGSISGYFGGVVDSFLMRLTELFTIIPRFFLAVVMVALFGSGIWKLVIVIGILSWPNIARVVRGEFLSLREREFVEAARALGFGSRHIIFREILPNAASAIIVLASLQVAQAIILEAGLSFFGLGDPNQTSWGKLLNDSQRFLRQAWWMSVFPGTAILLAVLGFNLVGDGLNDALNPRLKER